MFVFAKLKKNILIKELPAPVDGTLTEFSQKALTAYTLSAAIFFIFMPGGVIYELPWGKGLFSAFADPVYIVPAVVVCAFTLWCGTGFALRKKQK